MTQADFAKLVIPFKDKVFRLAKRLLVSREEAEDATQEILLKLWNNRQNIAAYRNRSFCHDDDKKFLFRQIKIKASTEFKNCS
jgi:RNA polymerase sigma-70 factor (ECF subfamily)